MKPYYNTGAVTVWPADVLAWALWYFEEIKAGRAAARSGKFETGIGGARQG